MIKYDWHEEYSESFGLVKRPVAEIHMKDKNKIWRAINMYVDSGADVSIIQNSFGELFGHNVEKGRKIRLKGIGKEEIIAYIHKMDLLIGAHEVNIEVAIGENDNVPNVLGRKGVFNFFEIQFKNKEEATHFLK
ncbi:MAG: hypothetical protein WC624_00350 [Candidatus Margulisiibacteriota bacterium]